MWCPVSPLRGARCDSPVQQLLRLRARRQSHILRIRPFHSEPERGERVRPHVDGQCLNSRICAYSRSSFKISVRCGSGNRRARSAVVPIVLDSFNTASRRPSKRVSAMRKVNPLINASNPSKDCSNAEMLLPPRPPASPPSCHPISVVAKTMLKARERYILRLRIAENGDARHHRAVRMHRLTYPDCRAQKTYRSANPAAVVHRSMRQMEQPAKASLLPIKRH